MLRLYFDAKWLIHLPNLLIQFFDISVNGKSIFPVIQAKNFNAILTFSFSSYSTSKLLVIMLVLSSEHIPDFDCFSPLFCQMPGVRLHPLLPGYRRLLITLCCYSLPTPALYSQPNIQNDLFETKSEPHVC